MVPKVPLTYHGYPEQTHGSRATYFKPLTNVLILHIVDVRCTFADFPTLSTNGSSSQILMSIELRSTVVLKPKSVVCCSDSYRRKTDEDCIGRGTSKTVLLLLHESASGIIILQSPPQRLQRFNRAQAFSQLGTSSLAIGRNLNSVVLDHHHLSRFSRWSSSDILDGLTACQSSFSKVVRPSTNIDTTGENFAVSWIVWNRGSLIEY